MSDSIAVNIIKGHQTGYKMFHHTYSGIVPLKVLGPFWVQIRMFSCGHHALFISNLAKKESIIVFENFTSHQLLFHSIYKLIYLLGLTKVN